MLSALRERGDDLDHRPAAAGQAMKRAGMARAAQQGTFDAKHIERAFAAFELVDQGEHFVGALFREAGVPGEVDVGAGEQADEVARVMAEQGHRAAAAAA